MYEIREQKQIIQQITNRWRDKKNSSQQKQNQSVDYIKMISLRCKSLPTAIFKETTHCHWIFSQINIKIT